MRAELLLRLVSEPNSLNTLSNDDLCELLGERDPLPSVLELAGRRAHFPEVMYALFRQPLTPATTLLRVVGQRESLLPLYLFHTAVHAGEVKSEDLLTSVLPEAVPVPAMDSKFRGWLQQHLPSATRLWLTWTPETEHKPARAYHPLAHVILLGDFLSYLTARNELDHREMPVMARIALALNPYQNSASFTNDADVRVRFAVKESLAWRS